MAENTIVTHSHSDKRRDPEKLTFIPLTMAEARALGAGAHVYFMTRFGTMAQAKISSIRTWKSPARANDTDIIKYGLRDFFTAQYRDGVATVETLARIVNSEEGSANA